MRLKILLILGTLMVGVAAILGLFLVFSTDPVTSRTGQAILLLGLGVGFLTISLQQYGRRRRVTK